MLTALDAKERSERNRAQKIAPYIQSIELQIEKATAHGDFSISNPLEGSNTQLPWPCAEASMILRKELENLGQKSQKRRTSMPKFTRISLAMSLPY